MRLLRVAHAACALNPRDFHDPFVTDFEEAKVGIPALQATYYAPDAVRLARNQLRATLIYLPMAVPLPHSPERAMVPGGRAAARQHRPRTESGHRVTERTRPAYAVWVDLEELDAEGDRMVGDDVAEDGIRSLKEINAGKRKIVRRLAA